VRKLLCVVCVAAFFGVVLVPECPAPLIWRKGEGWSYEKGGVTTGRDPAEQLALARKLQEAKSYDDAASAYRRLIRRWPTSSAAADAQLGLAECLNALGYHYKAYLEYQKVLETHPGTAHFDTVLQREIEIGNLFLAGEKHKVWRLKIYPATDKAIEIFENVVKNGPYTKVAPQAQFRVGLGQEKMKDYLAAVRAYEKLIERYPNDPLAEAAQFQIGSAYSLEAQRAEYDQNAANQAIQAFSDFLVSYPKSEKVALAQEQLTSLKKEQARGLFQIGQFYEKQKQYKAAIVYYNEVIEQNPRSDWGTAARDKVAKLTAGTSEPAANP
jgi:outer membrane protein assembly factor BamD